MAQASSLTENEFIVLRGVDAQTYQALPEAFKGTYAVLVSRGMGAPEVLKLVKKFGLVEVMTLARRWTRE